MSSFSFETLPDEILMIIFQYSGDVFNILRTFLGLNQRFNNILLDKRLHLLTDFLFINLRYDYYNSEIFQQASEQLLRINTIVDEEKLCQLLQPLLSFHIKQKYIELEQEFQSSLVKFTSVRQKLSDEERGEVDHELKTQFDQLDIVDNTSITMETIKTIKSFVLVKGARLECDDYELGGFNLAKAVNQYFLSHIIDTVSHTSISINSIVQLFKTLIISNISLINNRDYVGNGERTVDYFLMYALYCLRYFYRSYSEVLVNMKYYRTTVDFFLFILQCRKKVFENDRDIQDNMFEILAVSEIHNDLFIRTVQLEIVKIIVDEHVIKANEAWDDSLQNRFREALRQLFKNRRVDIIKYICDHLKFQEFLDEPNHLRRCVDIMTRNQLERRYFSMIMDDTSLDSFLSKKRLIFILLDKKERKLLEKLLKLSPCLINELDEDGNDPLLYICLKVYGCRHRIIEFLIKMGSDLERRNLNGQNFMEILQLQRNQKLFQKLIEHEIIKLDV